MSAVAAAAAGALPRRISNMQREVFGLYRALLRVATQKGGKQAFDMVRTQFRSTARSTTNIKVMRVVAGSAPADVRHPLQHMEAVFGRGKMQLERLRKAESISFASVARSHT